MSILTRYITGQFLYILFLTVASFVVLFLIADIFEDMNKIIDYQVPLGTAIWFAATHGTPVFAHAGEVAHARREYLE